MPAKKAESKRKTLLEGLKPLRERCRNPWNGRCEDTDIQVCILYRGEKLPLYSKCWREMCGSDLEWGGRRESTEGWGKVLVKCML